MRTHQTTCAAAWNRKRRPKPTLTAPWADRYSALVTGLSRSALATNPIAVAVKPVRVRRIDGDGAQAQTVDVVTV